MVATIVVLLAAAIVYAVYAVRTPGGPRGGTAIGLTFGIAGYGLMLFEGLLGARKKVPIWRFGRTQTWMRGHLWLGLLTLPLILFHAGFAFRGALTAVLMVLLVIVVVSGVLGSILQHFLPRIITTRVPMETIYEEIPHVRAQLREEHRVFHNMLSPARGTRPALDPARLAHRTATISPCHACRRFSSGRE